MKEEAEEKEEAYIERKKQEWKQMQVDRLIGRNIPRTSGYALRLSKDFERVNMFRGGAHEE